MCVLGRSSVQLDLAFSAWSNLDDDAWVVRLVAYTEDGVYHGLDGRGCHLRREQSFNTVGASALVKEPTLESALAFLHEHPNIGRQSFWRSYVAQIRDEGITDFYRLFADQVHFLCIFVFVCALGRAKRDEVVSLQQLFFPLTSCVSTKSNFPLPYGSTGG